MIIHTSARLVISFYYIHVDRTVYGDNKNHMSLLSLTNQIAEFIFGTVIVQ